jgi:hypothetical protein
MVVVEVVLVDAEVPGGAVDVLDGLDELDVELLAAGVPAKK